MELCYNNVWGRVCDDAWGNVDARVVCRQLGFSDSGALSVRSSSTNVGTSTNQRIWLDNVQCVGSEATLYSCPSNPVGSENCDNANEHAGVSCQAGKYRFIF